MFKAIQIIVVVIKFIKHYRQSPRMARSLLFIFSSVAFKQNSLCKTAKKFAIAKLIFTQQLTRFSEALKRLRRAWGQARVRAWGQVFHYHIPTKARMGSGLSLSHSY